MPSPGLEARIARARRSITRLRRIAEVPVSEYMADEDLQALAERHLHILLESILDLAAFIAAKRGLSQTPTYRGTMEAVIKAGLIPPSLVQMARAIPGMRNILVHGYAEIRHDLVYEAIKTDLGRIEEILSILYIEASREDP